MAKKFLDSAGLKATLQALKEKFVELTDKITINATYTDNESQTHNTTVESDFNTAEVTFKAEGDLTVKVENISGKPVVTYNAVIPESKNSILYSIAPKEMTTEESNLYSTVYQLYKQEGEQGAKSAVEGSVINIPLDFLVKSAELKVCETADVPEQGYEVGDKYIDFTINAKTKSTTATHLYINLKDFVDTYVAGNGIDVTNKTISAVAKNNSGIAVTAEGIALNITESNGLGLTNGSLTLDTATTLTAGAMSSTDKTKLDNLGGGNGINYDSSTNKFSAVVDTTNGLGLDSTNGITLNLATADTIVGQEIVNGTAGAMSSSDKTKLDNLEEMNALTSIEIADVIDEVFPVSEP